MIYLGAKTAPDNCLLQWKVPSPYGTLGPPTIHMMGTRPDGAPLQQSHIDRPPDDAQQHEHRRAAQAPGPPNSGTLASHSPASRMRAGRRISWV